MVSAVNGPAVQYVANAGGSDSFVYEVCDALGACDTAEATILVGTAGCTIAGTDEADTLFGTAGDDVICGLGGDDTIYGLGGDDILYGGDASLIGAADGEDLLWGGAGADTLYGGIGADGSIERSYVSPEDRLGYRNGVGKRPQDGLYLGYAVTFATATAGFYWAGKHDEIKFYPVRPYIVFVHTDPANADLCHNGLAGLEQSKRHEPTIRHASCDQGYSQFEEFLLGARELGIEPHFNVAKPQISRPPLPVYLANTGAGGTTERVLEHLGAHYHQWMPQRLRAPAKDCTREELAKLAAQRLPYRWDDRRTLSDGSVEKKCPFHAGKLYNPRFGIPKRRKSAVFVPDEDIPQGATKCCNGPAVATPEQLARIQAPPVGTIAHQLLMGYRNPVEGTNGVVKNRHGLQHTTCRAPGLIPHALAAAITAAVRNLQLTLDDELKRRRDHLRQKTRRKARNKTRREQQAPHDGRPAPAEKTSTATPTAPDQEPDGDTEAASAALAPPRAPP